MAGHTGRRGTGLGRRDTETLASVGMRVVGAVVRQQHVTFGVQQHTRRPKLLLLSPGVNDNDSGARLQMMADLLRQSTAAHERQFNAAGLVVLNERNAARQHIHISGSADAQCFCGAVGPVEIGEHPDDVARSHTIRILARAAASAKICLAVSVGH